MHIVVSLIALLALLSVLKILPALLISGAVVGVVGVVYGVVKWLKWLDSPGRRPKPEPDANLYQPSQTSYTLSYKPRPGKSPEENKQEFQRTLAAGYLDLSRFSPSSDAPDDYAALRDKVSMLQSNGERPHLTIEQAMQDEAGLPNVRGVRRPAVLFQGPGATENPLGDVHKSELMGGGGSDTDGSPVKQSIKTRYPKPFPGSRSTVAAGVAERYFPDEVPTRGLVIMAGPLDQILRGRKTMELRSRHNHQLVPIALIRKGTGRIEAVARFVESVGPFSLDDLYRLADDHQVSLQDIPRVYEKGWRYGWKLADLYVLPRPVPYVHRGMSWVVLNEEAVAELREMMR